LQKPLPWKKEFACFYGSQETARGSSCPTQQRTKRCCISVTLFQTVSLCRFVCKSFFSHADPRAESCVCVYLCTRVFVLPHILWLFTLTNHLHVGLQRVEERLSALGNCIATNDYVALTHTGMSQFALVQNHIFKKRFLTFHGWCRSW
jgi:hypothetical protein